KIEIYSRARFFTFTGHGFRDIRAADAELQAIAAEARAEQTTKKVEQAAATVEFKPAVALAHLDPNQELAKGIEQNRWFGELQPAQQDEVVDYALGVIAANTKMLELEADGGDNDVWYRITTAVARSGAPNAEEIFLKYASAAKDPDPKN